MNEAEQYALYKNDYLAMDGVETVTLTPAPGITGTAYNAAKAKFGELTRRELLRLAPELLAAPYDGVAILFTESLNSLIPEARYLITRGTGEKWTVQSAARIAFGTQYLCVLTVTR